MGHTPGHVCEHLSWGFYVAGHTSGHVNYPEGINLGAEGYLLVRNTTPWAVGLEQQSRRKGKAEFQQLILSDSRLLEVKANLQGTLQPLCCSAKHVTQNDQRTSPWKCSKQTPLFLSGVLSQSCWKQLIQRGWGEANDATFNSVTFELLIVLKDLHILFLKYYHKTWNL